MESHIEVMEEKKDKGFTLVELLIVIVILGILATVTVFAVRGITDQGQDSACAADQKTLEVAVESWYALNGTTSNPTEAILVTDGLLRSVSPTFDITGAGVVTPTALGACV
jgi:prepilin-type N-terminal cleavage/methylation domain-containing protein